MRKRSATLPPAKRWLLDQKIKLKAVSPVVISDKPCIDISTFGDVATRSLHVPRSLPTQCTKKLSLREVENFATLQDVEPIPFANKNQFDINSSSYDNLTPLMRAVLYNDIQGICKLIYTYGANIDVQNALGYSALTIAILEKHLEVALTLIQAGANCNLRTNEGHTPLMCSIITGQKLVMGSILKKGVDINAQNIYGYTAVLLAVMKNDNIATWTLIKAGADLNLASIDGNTPLRQAIFNLENFALPTLINYSLLIKAQNVPKNVEEVMYAYGNLYLNICYHLMSIKPCADLVANESPKGGVISSDALSYMGSEPETSLICISDSEADFPI
jgi:hypothetical protein